MSYFLYAVVLVFAIVPTAFGYNCGSGGVLNCTAAGIKASLKFSGTGQQGNLGHCIYIGCPSVEVLAGATLAVQNVSFGASKSDGGGWPGEAIKMYGGILNATNVRFRDFSGSTAYALGA